MPSDLDQQLVQAASAGDLAAVIAALGAGADVHARGPFGDTALNQAAECGQVEVVQRLLQAGANVENKGGADKTPIMNAAFAGHTAVVTVLVEKGAVINDDLLSSVQLKVNILAENAEAGMVKPEGVQAWQRFFDWLVAARLRQDLPQIIVDMSSDDADYRRSAASRLGAATERGVDISAALPRLRELTSDPDGETQDLARAALAAFEARA